MSEVTYLDNNATTRIDPRVLEAMMPYLTDLYGNPSSVHHFGSQVLARIEQAREQVAGLIGARPGEIVFTSGGTESDNAALRGLAAARPNRKHVIVSSVEHRAVLAPAELLEREGYRVTRLSVDRDGRLDLDELRAALCDDTLMVSVMLVNNETGVVYPLEEIRRIAHERGVPVHTDAVNAIGKMEVNVEKLGIDLLSLSAHKFYGPKGSGALYIRSGTPFRPLIVGGSHENGRRGGTHNVAGIVGLGEACRLAAETPGSVLEHERELRDRFEREIRERLPDVFIVAAGAPRVPNTSCLCVPGCTAQAIMLLLSEAGICVSSGSACSSGAAEPSHVLSAMGIEPELAQGQLRVSLGRDTTAAEIERLLEVLPAAARKVAAAG